MITTGLINVAVMLEVDDDDDDDDEGGVLGKTATGLWIGFCGCGIGQAFCGFVDRSGGGVRGGIRCRGWPPNLAVKDDVRFCDPIDVDSGRGSVHDRPVVSFSSSSLFLPVPIVFLPLATVAFEWSGSVMSYSSFETVRIVAWYLVS